MKILKFEPIYMERVWGGRMLSDFFKRNINCKSDKIGESWEIVDRPNAQSVASEGIYKGQSIRNIILKHSKSILGPGWNPKKQFPILVKWLDCKERLSLQVHPPAHIAKDLNGEPKTENWYIAESSENAGLFIGLKKNVNKAMFQKSIEQGTAESLCHRVKSQKGDSVLVESGRIHAIDKGNLILEIQQNSNTTFRVFDWGRAGLGNIERELHIEESLKCINFNDFEPKQLKTSNSNEKTLLAHCNHFRIYKFISKKGENIKLKVQNIDCMIIHLISGKIMIGEDIILEGEQVISPFSSECVLTALKNSTILVTDQFTNQS